MLPAGGLWGSIPAPSALEDQETPAADLYAGIPVGPAAAVAGSLLAYTPEVGNAGPDAAGDVQLHFAVTPLTRGAFREARPTRGTCATELNRCAGRACLYALGEPCDVECALGGLSPGETVTVTVTVVASAAAGTTLEADAAASSPFVPDPEGGNNGASRDTPLAAPSPGGGDSGGGGCFLESLPR
ncbi:MAG: hypothetical protein WHT06_13080 [Desulfobacterales bacterium]